MSNHLLTVLADGIATITFNRPQFRNAIDSDMIQQAIQFLGHITAEPGLRCLVIRGSGEHFCGGGDVRNFRTTLDASSDERRDTYLRRVEASVPLFERLQALPAPIIAIARGAVAGGGLGFALSADITLVSDTSFFVFAHSRIGLPLDTGLSYYLPRAVGYRRAKELAILGARLDASDALAAGLVNRVIPDSELETEADEVISQLARGATVAYVETRRLIDASFRNDVTEQVMMEAGAVSRAVATTDFIEGIHAFLDKRSARFGGN